MKHVILFEQFLNEKKVTPYDVREVRTIINGFNKEKKDPKKIDDIFFPDLVDDMCYALEIDCAFEDNPEAFLSLIRGYYNENSGKVEMSKNDIQGFADSAKMLSESKVNEAKFNAKKEVRELKGMGYDAEVFGDNGVVVSNHTAPNPNYSGKVDYVFDEDGIFSDDEQYTGNNQDFSTFLDILDDPTSYEGKFE